jgi:hypothetical protein
MGMSLALGKCRALELRRQLEWSHISTHLSEMSRASELRCFYTTMCSSSCGKPSECLVSRAVVHHPLRSTKLLVDGVNMCVPSVIGVYHESPFTKDRLHPGKWLILYRLSTTEAVNKARSLENKTFILYTLCAEYRWMLDVPLNVLMLAPSTRSLTAVG